MAANESTVIQSETIRSATEIVLKALCNEIKAEGEKTRDLVMAATDYLVAQFRAGAVPVTVAVPAALSLQMPQSESAAGG